MRSYPVVTIQERTALKEINVALAQVEADSQWLLDLMREHPYSSISQLERHSEWSRAEIEGLLFDLEQRGKVRAMLWSRGKQFVYRWVPENE